MIDPRQISSRLLGAIDWQTEVSGFCRCPGEAFHTSTNGKKDCRVPGAFRDGRLQRLVWLRQ